MEIQPPQSVQINFNNKIITLHNVTIVKNPKIITIDATQYSNFLKGSPMKLSNGTTTTTPMKLQMPSLVPMKITKGTAPAAVAALKTNPIVLNQTTVPVIRQSQKFISPQLIHTKNGIVQLKTSPNTSASSSSTVNTSFKFQTLPMKPPQQTVIISPPKVSMNNSTPVKIRIKQQQQTITPTYVVTKSPVTSIPTPAIVNSSKIIISPPQKNKTSPISITPPEAKRPCKKLEFPCLFCKDVFDDSNFLVEHLKVKHPFGNKIKIEEPEENFEKNETEVVRTITVAEVAAVKVENEIQLPPLDIKSEMEAEDDEGEDDDESEVNDLIMDLEDTQDAGESSQDRSDTPESPEFEEHVPTIKTEPEEVLKMEEEASRDEFDYEKFEYCSSIMEPICELSCEDDSNDGVQDENEAMRLYREAMEVNYQQNGIKKRGRRRQRKPKPLMENLTSLNGILAGLLDNSIKVPPGPGRGRRKEMNELELQMDRSNGVCLFSCNKCDESFKYAGDLAKHVRSHTISSPYQCSICQRKFTHIGSLNTHLRIHSGERPYKCNQCDKSFTQSNSLMVHVKSHLSNKPFQCHHCNKGFLNASSLALHTKTHTGPTTVTCPIDVCGKEFRDNNLLEEHMMTHRQSMLYQCSLCSEKFEQSCLLVQHVKSHIGDKPFQCNQCGKCFTQPGSLNTHLRIHTGEKPFECTICGKKFTQASSLSVHMKVHGEKEFKCVIENCKKSYSQEAYLKKHMQKHMDAALNDENNLQLTQE